MLPVVSAKPAREPRLTLPLEPDHGQRWDRRSPARRP
jgi:hypothetical protein